MILEIYVMAWICIDLNNIIRMDSKFQVSLKSTIHKGRFQDMSLSCSHICLTLILKTMNINFLSCLKFISAICDAKYHLR